MSFYYRNYSTKNYPKGYHKGYGYSYNQQGTCNSAKGFASMGDMQNFASSGGIQDMGGSTTMVKSYTTTGGFSSTDRLHEKQELQRLHDRITAYIIKVRQMDGTSIDSGAFLQNIKSLEQELMNLKVMYENELKNVRHQLDVMTTERNNYQAQFSKNQQSASDMQGRLQLEVDKNRKLVDEINMLQKRIAAMEVELNNVKISANQPLQDIHRLQKEVENLTRENEMLKARLQKEGLLVKEAEDRLRQMAEKMQFSDQVNIKQTQELKGRLDHSAAAILNLEARIRDSGKVETNVPDLLKQVRGAAAEEFRKYQVEAEATYNKNIGALKAQMESDAKGLQAMNAEKAQLIAMNGEFKARISALEGQVQALIQEKSSLEAIIQQERNAYAEQIQALVQKLHGIQEMLFVKLKEASVSQEASVSLKAEIQSMKILLDEEERRLFSRVSSGQGQTITYSTATPRVGKMVSYSVGTPRTGQNVSYAKASSAGHTATYSMGSPRQGVSYNMASPRQTVSYTTKTSYGGGPSYMKTSSGGGGQTLFTKSYKFPTLSSYNTTYRNSYYR